MQKHILTSTALPALAATTAACILIFCPLTANANYVKHGIWWSALPLVAGLAFLEGNPIRPTFKSMRLSRGSGHWQLAVSIYALSIFIQGARVGAWAGVGRELSLIAGAWVVATVLSDRNRIAAFWRILIETATLAALYTIVQYLGHDFLNWQDKRRPPGTFSNPNFTANCLAAILPLTAFWEIVGREASRDATLAISAAIRRFARGDSIPWRTAIQALAIGATFSRGGYIAAAASVACAVAAIHWLLHLESRRSEPGAFALAAIRRSAVRIALLSILAAELAIGLIVWTAPDKAEHLLSGSTVMIRARLWEGSISLWREAPWIGHGLDSFASEFPGVKYLVEPLGGDRNAIHAHSWLFERLVEDGLIGLALFLGLILSAAATLTRGARNPAAALTRLTSIGSLCGIAALLSGGMVGVWFDWWGGKWMFWLLAAFGIASAFPDERTSDRPAIRDREIGSALIAAAFLVAIWSAALFRNELDLHKTRRLVASGQPAAALELMDRISTRPFTPADYSYWRAAALLQLGQTDQALKAIEPLFLNEKETARRGKWTEALLLRARIEAARDNLPEAEATIRLACNHEPSGATALALADILIARNKSNDAAKVLGEQLARQVYAPLIRRYAEIERRRGNTRLARDFLSSMRQDPTHALRSRDQRDLARWEGDLSMLIEDWFAAIQAYRSALLDDLNAEFEIWNDYGMALRNHGRLNQADLAFERSHALAPDSVAPLFNRLETALLRNDALLAEKLIVDLRSRPLPPEFARRLEEMEKEQ